MKKILITAGPTRERIDGVRFISNFSTGVMGYELAKAAVKRGLEVTLISGPTALLPPEGARFVSVEAAREMENAVRRNFKACDCLFMAAAVSDFRPDKEARGKIRKKKALTLRLVENPDILKKITRDKDKRIVAGFALESGNVIKNAQKKLKKKNLDFIVANRLSKEKPPFGAGAADVVIIDRYGEKIRIKNAPKRKIAEGLLDKANSLWERGR